MRADDVRVCGQAVVAVIYVCVCLCTYVYVYARGGRMGGMAGRVSFLFFAAVFFEKEKEPVW